MKLYDEITAILAVYDQQTIDALIASIPARREAQKAVWDEHSEKRMNNVWGALFEAVGGKGWYELLKWGDADLAEKITKREKANAEARNAKIAHKLEQLGVAEIVDAKPVYTSNGFTGIWKLQSEKGQHTVKIEVILAGGYNIQCLHHRVLVKVK